MGNDNGDFQNKTNKLKLAMYYIALVAITIFGSVFIIGAIFGMYYDLEIYKIALNHFPAVIGLPCAALAAICIVMFLESSSGKIEFECIGFKFKGASGPIVFWVFCFLSITMAIKVLWDCKK